PGRRQQTRRGTSPERLPSESPRPPGVANNLARSVPPIPVVRACGPIHPQSLIPRSYRLGVLGNCRGSAENNGSFGASPRASGVDIVLGIDGTHYRLWEKRLSKRVDRSRPAE